MPLWLAPGHQECIDTLHKVGFLSGAVRQGSTADFSLLYLTEGGKGKGQYLDFCGIPPQIAALPPPPLVDFVEKAAEFHFSLAWAGIFWYDDEQCRKGAGCE